MVVIAAIDGSVQAKKNVAESVKLAEAFDDTVRVVHVLSQSKFVDLEQTEVRKNNQPIAMDQIRKSAARVAEQAAEDIETNVELDYVGLVGDAADQIVDYAESEGARYIVVGTRKKSPTGKALFGSVSQKVLLNADCPVVLTVTKS